MLLEVGSKVKEFGFMNFEDPQKWTIDQMLKVNALMSDSAGYLYMIDNH
jgi:hypothetical protein